ncbi:glycosyltransferase family 4 protein [Polaribacter tangerinus]|uniref:glycosyltransferase family 4 protein n=1 Tax=Polaribacter tangerinus TaxID=1920034 RepID=UPI000B4AEF22|nr:MraY family glycosyltransferase [Polaribacter tangerinus]
MNTIEEKNMELLTSLNASNFPFKFLFIFMVVFLVSFFIIPKIRSISLYLNLTDQPNNRSSHTHVVPSFGGVSFYISYLLVLFFSQSLDDNHVSLTLIVSISILFFTGFLDDLKNLSPKFKLIGQILGVAVLMFQPDFRILSLHGFLGVYELPFLLSISISMLFLLSLINAFNLIDGIDGLTGITGIIVASFYSFMFFKLDFFFYFSICLATIATLLAFLRFNFSKTKKIFMGDTGSLVVGLVLGLLTLKLLSLGNQSYQVLSFNREQLPLFLGAVLFVPLLDMFRVMLLRAIRGVSMFKPDRNHIHHIITDFGFSHRKASFSIGVFNFIIAFTMFLVIRKYTSLQSTLILVSLFVIAILLIFLMNKNKKALQLKLKIKKSMLRLFF